jgi:hypothetical protein
MIRHPQHGNIDEYLELLRSKITNGFPVLSAGFTLLWYADQYQCAKTTPAEPGGIASRESQESQTQESQLSLQQIDTLRSLIAAGRKSEALIQLETIAAQKGR